MDTQLSLMPDLVEPKERTITTNQAALELRRVRAEEGLKDYTRTPHVHRYYKPAMRCICGKKQEQVRS